MAKILDLGLLARFCEAMGVERVDEVTRVVLDIRSGQMPVLLVERIADAEKITAALAGPRIEVRRDDGAVAEATKERHREAFRGSVAPQFHGNVSGANVAWGNGSVTQNSRG